METRRYNNEAHVIRREDNGETREYILFPQFELIKTIVPAGYAQPLHRHEIILEYYIVLEGEVDLVEGDVTETLGPGDSVLVKPSVLFHTVKNPYDKPATMLTFKLVPHEQEDLSQIFKTDKVLL